MELTDLRYACRLLGRSRTFTLATLLLLAGGVRTTFAGAAAGTLAALAAAGFVESLLFGVSARDPVTFVGVPVVLASTALVACVVPAWRASRLDPVSVLRAE